MRIALIDPFYDESHKFWSVGLKDSSSHVIDIFFQNAVYWKWKMTGGSLELADEFNSTCQTYDLLLVTDMLNVPLFLSALKPQLKNLPCACYFHENQITYPWSDQDRDVIKSRDHHYGFINFSSALIVDKVFFNSQFHMDDFMGALPGFLRQFPSFNYQKYVDRIKSKSRVLPIGIHEKITLRTENESPVFIWNHRWEYDKNPETFFGTLFELKRKGVHFKLIILGKSFDVNPSVFKEAQKVLENEIIHCGFVNKERYNDFLKSSNIVLVTCKQDFFGISVIEAIQAGCYPIIPDRLVYKEHIPPALVDQVLYKREDQILPMLENVIRNKLYLDTLVFQDYIKKYYWKAVIGRYDEEFSKLGEK